MHRHWLIEFAGPQGLSGGPELLPPVVKYPESHPDVAVPSRVVWLGLGLFWGAVYLLI
jgi:hypothetical protein